MLEERAIRTPVLVAVDDVQWVDRLSSFALRIMPGRLAGSAVVWLFAARTHSAAPIEDVIPPSSSDVTIEQIRLGPLPPAAIEELALQRRGVLPSGRLRQLLGMASGYPFLAVALLDGYPTEDLTNSAAAAMPARLDETPFEVENGLPQKLIDSVLRRLRMLPPDAKRRRTEFRLTLDRVSVTPARPSGRSDYNAGSLTAHNLADRPTSGPLSPFGPCTAR
jgi:hypothetical protein